MADRIICAVHTTRVVIDRVHRLLSKEFPDYKIIHLLDETLLEDFARLGGTDARVRRRLLSMVSSAEEAGAAMVLVTCSSLGDTVYEVQKFVGIPVLKVDEGMAEAAVSRCRRIGVLATAKSASCGTAELIKGVAAKQGKDVEVVPFICADAAKHAAKGPEEFNRYLSEEAARHATEVDGIMVSQVSMCGIDDYLAPDGGDKVLTALNFVVGKMRKILEGR